VAAPRAILPPRLGGAASGDAPALGAHTRAVLAERAIA
jgi:hypothetical protein